MPKPVCVKCQRFFRMTKAGKPVLEQMPVAGSAAPGTACPTDWRPYKLWQADLWTCQGCGFQLVTGFGKQAVAERYEDGFKDELGKVKANMVTVNDC